MSENEAFHTPDDWNAVADAYDRSIAAFTGAFAEDLFARAALTLDHHVLEVAAGTGAVTVQIAPRVERVTATDYAQGMLERLRARIAEAGCDNVEVHLADGMDLRLETDTFDTAICNFGLMLFSDRVVGFRELHRVLQPGGRAVVSGWSTPDKFEAWNVMATALATAFPDLPGPDEPPPIFSLADTTTFDAEMRAGGFTDVEIDSVTRVLEADSPEHYWDMMAGAAPPSRAMLDRLGDDGIARFRDQLVSDLRERFGDGPVRLSCEARIGVGVK